MQNLCLSILSDWYNYPLKLSSMSSAEDVYLIIRKPNNLSGMQTLRMKPGVGGGPASSQKTIRFMPRQLQELHDLRVLFIFHHDVESNQSAEMSFAEGHGMSISR